MMQDVSVTKMAWQKSYLGAFRKGPPTLETGVLYVLFGKKKRTIAVPLQCFDIEIFKYYLCFLFVTKVRLFPRKRRNYRTQIDCLDQTSTPVIWWFTTLKMYNFVLLLMLLFPIQMLCWLNLAALSLFMDNYLCRPTFSCHGYTYRYNLAR